MTEYEIISLLRETGGSVAQEFEFFLTATFAVIFATYAVGTRLLLFPRILIAILYLAASALFYNRYVGLSEQAAYFFSLLSEMSSGLPQPDFQIQGPVRRGIMFFGALATVFTIFRPIVSQSSTGPNPESAADT